MCADVNIAASGRGEGGEELLHCRLVGNQDVCLDRVIKQRLAIIGKLAKLDSEGWSTRELRGTSLRHKCVQRCRNPEGKQ